MIFLNGYIEFLNGYFFKTQGFTEMNVIICIIIKKKNYI